jgi:hypothetical protein
MMGDDLYGTTTDEERASYGHAATTGLGIALLIAGIVLYLVTTNLVAQCRADLSILTGPGVCSGFPVMAYHLQAGLVAGAGVLAGIGVIMLIANRQP